MGWPLRILSSSEIYHVCTRTTKSEIWMIPNPQMNRALGLILARVQHRYNIIIYAYCFLGNHFHLLLKGKKQDIPMFMKDVKSAIACKLKKISAWEGGRLWHRRYDCEIVFEDKLLQMFCYVTGNAVSSNLIGKCSEYPGLSSYNQAITGQIPIFIWTDWSRYNKDKKITGNSKIIDIKDYQTEYKLELSPLPIWQKLSEQQRFKEAQKVLMSFENTCESKRENENKKILGGNKILNITPGHKPLNTKKENRPYCHTNCPQRRMDYIEFCKQIISDFRKSSKQFLSGMFDAIFPKLTFRPPAWQVAT